MFGRVLCWMGAGLLACSVLAGQAAAGPQSSVEVKGLQVDFLPGGKVRVRGQLRCRGLRPYKASFSSEVDVNLDFPHGKRGFTSLADGWVGQATDPELRRRERAEDDRPFHRYEGRRYFEGQRALSFYNGTYLLHSPVLDKPLMPLKDEGRWIAFDKTLVFKALAKKASVRYRVVVGLKISHAARYFSHRYVWVVYGPFSWGEAPPCERTLLGRYRTPVFFTEKGLRTKQPVGKEPGTPAWIGEKDEVKKKRPKPARTGKRPTQLAAANASAKLSKTLSTWTGVENAGARANPFVGRVDLRHAATLAPDALTQLAARAAVEAAYAFPWVKSLELVLSKGPGAITVTLPWDAAANHAAKETTLPAFFKTWTVKGGTLAEPKAK